MKRRLAFFTVLRSASLAALQGAPPDGAIFLGAEQAMTKPQIRAAIAKLKPRKLPTELLLPVVFSHHMVLQRDMPVPVWGRAVPGAEHYGANYPLRIASLAPFAVRGIAGADQTAVMPALVRSWRAAWGKSALPFIYVNKKNFTAAHRDALAMLPHTARAEY